MDHRVYLETDPELRKEKKLEYLHRAQLATLMMLVLSVLYAVTMPLTFLIIYGDQKSQATSTPMFELLSARRPPFRGRTSVPLISDVNGLDWWIGP